MNDKTETKDEEVKPESKKKPDETGGFYFSSSLKISDPETQEVLVHVRGDN